MLPLTVSAYLHFLALSFLIAPPQRTRSSVRQRSVIADHSVGSRYTKDDGDEYHVAKLSQPSVDRTLRPGQLR